MKMSHEMMEKARSAQSASELMHMAHEHGMEMTDAEANKYFDMLHPAMGEMSDDELDNVSGGGCGGGGSKKDEAPYLFNIGDRVIYAANPDATGPGTVYDRMCSDNVNCKYSVVLDIQADGKPLFWIPEHMLKKYEG